MKPHRGRVKVILTPMGNKFRYRIIGKVCCVSTGHEIRNTGTVSLDRFWKSWKEFFPTRNELDRFIKRNKAITKIYACNDLHVIHPCDRIGGFRTVSREEFKKNDTDIFWYGTDEEKALDLIVGGTTFE